MISARQPLAESAPSDGNEIKAIQAQGRLDLGVFNLFWEGKGSPSTLQIQ